MAYEIGLSTPTVPNRGFTLWIWSVVLVIVAGFFVLGRLAIRFHNRRIGTDDWVILASLIASVLLTVTECSAVHYGYGKRLKDIALDDRAKALKWFYGAQIVYKVVITVNKISFLCLYLRIFIQPVFRRICYGGIAFLSAWGVAYILVTIFQCTPVNAYWDKTITQKTCVNSKAQWLSYAVINIVCDVAILALPVYPVSQLHLARGKKIPLAAMFGLGTFVCITSIIRTTTLAESANNKSKDPTSGPIPATIWSVIEANVGIICACLPVYHQPLKWCLPRLFGSQHSAHLTTSRSRGRGQKTPGSSRSLQDRKYMAWRELHGNGGSSSNNVSTLGFEMCDVEGRKTEMNEIMRMTDVSVSYQDDQRSDASSRPIRGRAED
ncbi:hypothetical protein CNMCM8980_000075 [Aspergillus fumigatiaffinis]|uniref:Rhodopsin domain-containing protein n=1 Tax=Aspergillus fumigatiaffinis TaxID=340414 RepID=A0A8H4GJA5_9EURO|nr:hypothetical protein CNMCM5878_008856 [Aspergillus fumigatiaffinis]KAF4223094.1 hypothetical protein CNMCM6457_000722 [Aspergillus fumigatiaffinis]KAF4233196.1 hypothetical protein CNMCM6805_009412 [Aspergillus fumigatiaffinis]KAF4243409.1 hypothetical protein CNMCM8980_000075 [Aspergillus fumigatiaffinis]